MLEPIFSAAIQAAQGSSQPGKPAGNASQKRVAAPTPTVAPTPSYRKKTIKRVSSTNFGVPSIKDALQGKFKEEEQKLSAKEQHEIYSQPEETQPFTNEDLVVQWKAFLLRLDDRPHLKSTLAEPPELMEGYKLILTIDNSIQEDSVNLVKPELISFLRKALKNSNIQLTTKISENARQKIIYSDMEKFEEMVKKNPSLALLKRKFNLDFGQ